MVYYTRVSANDYQRLLVTLNILKTQVDTKQQSGDYATTTDIANLQTQINGKQTSGSYATTTQLSTLQTTVDGKQVSGDYMTRGGEQTLTANITAPTGTTYTFMGAKPSEIACLSGLTSSIKDQLDGKQVSGSYATTTQLSTLQTTVDGKQASGDYMTRGGQQTLTANITVPASNTYTFMGAKPTEIAYLSGLTSSIKDQLDGKQATGTYMTRGGEQTLTANITVPASNTFTFMGAKPTEIAYLSGLTSSIKDQLAGKQPSGSYATTSQLSSYLPLTGGSISSTLEVSGVTTLSGGFRATGGAITVTKSNINNATAVFFAYDGDLGKPSIGLYAWSIRRNTNWAAGEDNWSMGLVSINTTTGIVYHWVYSASNLTVSASPNQNGGFSFTNNYGAGASYTLRMNKLI